MGPALGLRPNTECKRRNAFVIFPDPAHHSQMSHLRPVNKCLYSGTGASKGNPLYFFKMLLFPCKALVSCLKTRKILTSCPLPPVSGKLRFSSCPAPTLEGGALDGKEVAVGSTAGPGEEVEGRVGGCTGGSVLDEDDEGLSRPGGGGIASMSVPYQMKLDPCQRSRRHSP